MTFSFLLFSALFLMTPYLLDKDSDNTNVPLVSEKHGFETPKPAPIVIWRPVAPDIARMKREGCVADGILSGYNKPEIDIPIAKESNCYYFHRALETWLEPPDFSEAKEILDQIDRKDAVYGMFIAEAIDVKADYMYREEGRLFDFREMCRKQTSNFWGEHTCIPSLKKPEYQAYLKQITRDAMDIGIRSFLFGQLEHQDEKIRFPKVDNVIDEMRDYAEEKGIEIVIGGQTGEITREKYLREFDFIEGGVGLWPDGHVEEGPCFTKYWKQEGDWCWPLMWHEEFSSKAEHVFVYLDWNGQIGDDMHVFASMPENLRHASLKRLDESLTQRDIGFLFPLITPLPRDGDGNCHGPRKKYYSPSMDHGCRDIDQINSLLDL